MTRLPQFPAFSPIIEHKHGTTTHRRRVSPVLAGLVLALAGHSATLWAESAPSNAGLNRKPDFLGAITATTYDGSTDDLLTGGLGKSGLAGAAPTYVDPAQPTASELRRHAIYVNYRALVDISANGGYGRLYGPNIDTNGNDTLGEGKVAGTEYLAYASDGRDHRVTLMVQVPADFDPKAACIVTGVSSGSRGVYGAIGTAGEWGLKHGCAVAYSDKGTGMGVHDLAGNTVNLIDGTRADAATAGDASHFTAPLSAAQIAAYNATWPDRVAMKHAHSQTNPEKDWGRTTLQAIQFAYYVLNERYGTDVGNGRHLRDGVVPRRTIVIASSVSNGGGASLRAAEEDRSGLINGVVVSEPQVQPALTAGLVIRQGGATMPAIGKPLVDYVTYANLYQPCAVMAPELAGTNSAFNAVDVVRATERCTQLAAKGLVNGATTEARGQDALARLHAYGWLPESDALHASHYGLNATQAIAATYVAAYGRFSVTDNICGYSYGNTDAAGLPTVPSPALPILFAVGNGVPPMTGVNLIYNRSVGGPRADALAVSPSSSKADYNLDGALCLRALAIGRDPVSGVGLAGESLRQALRVAVGVQEVLANGVLHGKPTLIVAGRADALVPVNHGARAYYALNQRMEGGRSRAHYIEVTHGQHFDGFLALAGFPTRFIPLHYYFGQAMDRMYAHLRTGAPLPESQVVRTTPRTDPATPVTTANLPPIVERPASDDAIRFSGNTLLVP